VDQGNKNILAFLKHPVHDMHSFMWRYFIFISRADCLSRVPMISVQP